MASPERPTAVVLVADDDPLIRAVLRMALGEQGHIVTEARDSSEARTIASRSGADLVVLDMNMPGGTLQDTVDALRAEAPQLPILVLSGESEPPASLDLEACEFARKPIDLDEFLARVDRLLLTASAKS